MPEHQGALESHCEALGVVASRGFSGFWKVFFERVHERVEMAVGGSGQPGFFNDDLWDFGVFLYCS